MTTTHYQPLTARKPYGGFVLLSVEMLCVLWWVYRQRTIQLRDLRVWLACHEMVARRCQTPPVHVPHYTLQELHRLVGGVGGEHLRVSLRRLAAVGLLTWAPTTLTFATSPTALQGVPDRTGLDTMLQAIPNPHRRVPVPRQALRLIAGGCRATVIATMFGHLIRCLYYREHGCRSGGWCKASWIATVFQVDLRTIKAARHHLVAIGWLQMLPTPQHLSNRWGSYTRISLTWTRAALEKNREDPTHSPLTGSPLPSDFSTTVLPPPFLDPKPLQDPKHQQPAPPTDTASPVVPLLPTVPTDGETTGDEIQGHAHIRTPALQSPTLHHIVLDDLQDTGRLLALFEQAYTLGLIGKSDSERLTFLATAEHARVIGSTNPCGLFAALVRRRHWHYVTDSDEHAAYRRLKHYLYGPDAPRAAPACMPPEPPALSKDAAIVRYLQTELARVGFHGDVFGLVSRDDTSWTRVRWDHAVLELAHAQQAWQQANDHHHWESLTSLEACLTAVAASPEVDME